MQIKKVALIPNPKKDVQLKYTKQICRVRHQAGATPVLLDSIRSTLPNCTAESAPDHDTQVQRCDAVLTVGGDGTIIHAAKHSIKYGRPLLGINCGRLGFLAELETEEIGLITRLVSGDFTIVPRMMLQASWRCGEHTATECAVNDISISRGNLPHMIDIGVQCCQQNFCGYRADGMIFSTPVGSTAYSLSAGGPVVDPAMDCILMTPICPHTLFARPVVFGGQNVLEVRLSLEPGECASLSIDGEPSQPIRAGDVLHIQASSQHLQLIQIKSRLFYDIFTAKFSGSDR